jgi:hypothetical protein
MPPSTFNRLVENIRRRGRPESLPLCAEVDGKADGSKVIEIVSGHHRIRAARAAGLTEIDALVDVSGLSRSSIVAKQLAHNALVGKDDDAIVRQLVAMLETPDDLLETGLDDTFLPPVEGDTIKLFSPRADFDWKTLTFVFLPHQMGEFKDLLAAVEGKQDLVGAAPAALFDPFLKAASGYARLKEIRNVGTVIALLTRIALAEIQADQAQAASPTSGVPPVGSGPWTPNGRADEAVS